MKIIALLPIKKHSERVPGKNFRMLGGNPLYQHMLYQLLDMPEIDQVVVNTDSDILHTHSKLMTRPRKPELCGDDVDMNRIIADDVAATDGDIYIQTHATNPFLSADTIRRALVEFEESGCPALMAVTRIHARCYDVNHTPINHDVHNIAPTQSLHPVTFDNSCFYIFTRGHFKSTGERAGWNPQFFETPPLESIDIDTEDDWKLATMIAQCTTT